MAKGEWTSLAGWIASLTPFFRRAPTTSTTPTGREGKCRASGPSDLTASAVSRRTNQITPVTIPRRGGQFEATIRMIDGNVPVTTVWASRGKAARAEPVSALYEQGKVHHIGSFPQLES